MKKKRKKSRQEENSEELEALEHEGGGLCIQTADNSHL